MKKGEMEMLKKVKVKSITDRGYVSKEMMEVVKSQDKKKARK